MSPPKCPHRKCGPATSNSQEETPRKDAATLPDKGYYDAGYICAVHETLATVAQLIFKDSEGIKENPVLLKQCLDELERIYNPVDPSYRMGKIRPCILCTIVDPSKEQSAGIFGEGPNICIMGTFGGETPPDRIYQHFGVAVFPYRRLGHKGDVPKGGRPRDHIHTWPCPWSNENQLVIAYAYRSPGPILGVWRVPQHGGRGGGRQPSTFVPGAPYHGATAPEYWLDVETRSWLQEQCEERLDSWSKLCREDLTFAPGCALEFRVRTPPLDVFYCL
ncbi:hypothetical protein TRAPUB_722 [Trametes pubescens]|uniref:Uncharacterized protein n=1 Tax=Trametes pubescens TaxID=154538 RepID=A0A1M2VLF7_TRAPU|nr:hypothetical protein TRAPUB_722 [Trametes pubescens]